MSRSRTTLAVLNLGWTCMKSDLRAYFLKFGVVGPIQIPMNYQTGLNKNVGFVSISGEEGFVETILQDHHIIDGKEVTVKLRTHPRMNPDTDS